jgi:hypothetical protein
MPAIALLTLATLTACAPRGLVPHTLSLPGGQALVSAAETRAVYQIAVDPGSVPGQVTPKHVTCAEPSPDIVKAVSDAFQAGASLDVSGLPADVKPHVAAALAVARSQSAAQLGERIATIQLLRDALYRACEAYANGAISNTTYAVILSGFGDTMVSMLGSELAAGAFGRSLAGLGTEAAGKAAATAEISEKLKEHREAEAHLLEKRSEARDLQASLKETRTEARDIQRSLREKRTEARDTDKSLNEQRVQSRQVEGRLAEARDQQRQVRGELDRATPDRTSAVREQLDQKNVEVAKLETELKETKKEVARLEADLEKKDGEIRKLETHLETRNSEVMKLETQAEHKAREVANAERELAAKLGASAETVTKAMFQAAGGIAPGQQSPEIARTLAEMQRKYMENINFNALEIACITAMDRRMGERERHAASWNEVVRAAREYGEASRLYAEMNEERRAKAPAGRIEPEKTEAGKFAESQAKVREAALKLAAVAMGSGLTPLGAFCMTDLLPTIQSAKGRLLDAILGRAWAERDRARKPSRQVQLEEYVKEIQAVADLLKQVRLDK